VCKAFGLLEDFVIVPQEPVTASIQDIVAGVASQAGVGIVALHGHPSASPVA